MTLLFVEVLPSEASLARGVPSKLTKEVLGQEKVGGTYLAQPPHFENEETAAEREEGGLANSTPTGDGSEAAALPPAAPQGPVT